MYLVVGEDSFIFIFVYVWVSICKYVHESCVSSVCLVPKEVIRSLGTVVGGSCEPVWCQCLELNLDPLQVTSLNRWAISLYMLFLTAYLYRKPQSQILSKLPKVSEPVSRGVETETPVIWLQRCIANHSPAANINSAFTPLLSCIFSSYIWKQFSLLAITLQSGCMFGKPAEWLTVVSDAYLVIGNLSFSLFCVRLGRKNRARKADKLRCSTTEV